MSLNGMLPHPSSRATHPQKTEPCPAAGPFIPTAKTWTQFIKELQGLQVIECRSHGPGAQHMRTVYQPIGCVFIYENAHLPWNFLKEPSYHWWTGHDVSPADVKKAKVRYDCWGVESPYRPEGSDAMTLYFRTFESCARWVWDHRRADFQKPLHPYLIVTYDGEVMRYVRRIFEERDDVHTNPYELCHESLGSNQMLLPLDQATPEMLAKLKGEGS